MGHIFRHVVYADRTIKLFATQPMNKGEKGINNLQFVIPKRMYNLPVYQWVWWFVYVNAKNQKFTVPLVLSDYADDPNNYCVAQFDVDFGITLESGWIKFSLEAVDADSQGVISHRWRSNIYRSYIGDSLEGNQIEYDETESDIISALIQQVQNKVNSLVGGATPFPVQYKSQMVDHDSVYLYVGTEQGEYTNYWYYWDGSDFIHGGLYASGITVDSVPTQGSTNAVSSGGVWDEIEGVKSDVSEIDKSVFATIADINTYIPFRMQNGDRITVKTVSGENFAGTTTIGLYDANKQHVANFNVGATYGAERTLNVTLSADVSYIRLVPNSFEGEQLIILNNSNVAYEAFNEVVETINNTINYSLRGEIDQSENFTNKYYISLNVGVGNQVDITPVSNVQRGYIILPCKKGDSFVLTAKGGSAPRAWGFTDESYKLLSVAGSGVNASELTLIASSDGYLIVNHSNTDPYSLVATQLIKALSETEIRNIVNSAVTNNSIVVDASGNGDYTSFTLACKENYGNNRNIVVKAGTYDIVAEYVAIWGQSAVDNMADADSSVFDGWQYGVKMNGRKFTFEPGAKIVCDWTGHTVDGTHRFSALRVEMDVEIVGLDLDCTATFYAIHDDYGVQTRSYTNIYRHCRVIGHNLSNVNCIGGGCKKWSRHIIDNCYFDNNTTGSTAVRYHNTNREDAEPEIFVSDSYFNTFFRVNWYGDQTSKMKVYVNNSFAKMIYKSQESDSYTTDNVDLYKWNNTETDPVGA